MTELPLVLFTLLSQMAAGAFLTLHIMQSQNKMDDIVGKSIAKVIVGILGFGLLCSTSHLGDPMGAYRAISNIASSWLSREIVLFGGFFVLTFGSSWLSREIVLFGGFFVLTFGYYYKWQDKTLRRIIGTLGSFLAVISVIASGLVYTLPARPAWDSPFPVAFFMISALVLGPLLVTTIASIKKTIVCKKAFRFMMMMLVIDFLCFLMFISMMGDILSMNHIFIVARVMIGMVVPICLIWWSLHKEHDKNLNILPWVFILIILGEFMGRLSFYQDVLPYTMFG
jgi:anaerobic dimethyl sulfoxide reductase subunit C